MLAQVTGDKADDITEQNLEDLRAGTGETPMTDPAQPPAEATVEPPEYLTLRQLADRAGVSAYTLRKLIKRGELPAVVQAKPSPEQQARAIQILDRLTAQGYSEDAIREACRLAGERGARRGLDCCPT